jgi:hypothetical protein
MHSKCEEDEMKKLLMFVVSLTFVVGCFGAKSGNGQASLAQMKQCCGSSLQCPDNPDPPFAPPCDPQTQSCL